MDRENHIKSLRLFAKFRSLCKARRVPADMDIEWGKGFNEQETYEEAKAYLEQKTEYVKVHYPEIPMERYLMEINNSCDWDDLRYYADVYWSDMLALCKDAVRLGANHVVEQVAPHLLFGNDELLKELLSIASNEVMSSTLQNCMIFRHDEDYLCNAFSMAFNDRHWKYEYSENGYLIRVAEGLQEALWHEYINRISHGSELLYYEYLTADCDEDRVSAHVIFDRDRCEFWSYDLGYRITNDGFEKMSLQRQWLENPNKKGCSNENKIFHGASNLCSLMHLLKWDIEFDGVKNHFGYTGYVYLKSIPPVEVKVSPEDRFLKLFHSAFNRKIEWRELASVMSENCHYYSDGSKRDITGREEIIAFLKEISEELQASGILEHAHYARLKKPICAPELLEHKEGERIIAIWQGELGEYYNGILFFRINDEELVDDIYLCQDSRYRFRPFVPISEEG